MAYIMPAIQSRSSSSETLPLWRAPSSHVPVPALAARSSSLCPIPLLPLVQKGITVMSVKSWLSTNVLRMRGAAPHQMG